MIPPPQHPADTAPPGWNPHVLLGWCGFLLRLGERALAEVYGAGMSRFRAEGDEHLALEACCSSACRPRPKKPGKERPVDVMTWRVSAPLK
jgi:hypothetical protein